MRTYVSPAAALLSDLAAAASDAATQSLMESFALASLSVLVDEMDAADTLRRIAELDAIDAVLVPTQRRILAPVYAGPSDEELEDDVSWDDYCHRHGG